MHNLQTVVQPVRIEERVIVHLPMLTATVPVGTQEITARPEVSICANTDNRWSKKGTIGPFVFADCSPACQNGGTCHRSSSDAYCDCPSGYTGSYCQTRGMHCYTHTTMQQRSSWSMKHARAYSMYVHLFHIADCSPACQNRGTCNRSPWSAYCRCPSGYTGSYCQTRGMHCCTHNHAA